MRLCMILLINLPFKYCFIAFKLDIILMKNFIVVTDVMTLEVLR